MSSEPHAIAKDPSLQKVVFRLKKDEDDYPPDDYESLWALNTEEDLYEIDNIPFFVRGVSPGDWVSVKRSDGVNYFQSVERESPNSVLRVVAYDESLIPQLRETLVDMGCQSELIQIYNLIAIEVPQEVHLDSVLTYLEKGEKAGDWGYETACLRS